MMMMATGDAATTTGSSSVSLTAERLDVASDVAALADPRVGGIAVFLGTTRAEDRPDGQQLIALDYEAYADMATAQLQEVAARACRRWPIVKVVLRHRSGRVPVGEPSVLVAVSTPHRAEAFEACRWLIDTLKAEVAIWKKEVWADGTGSWVPGRPASPE
jgi:molybdopterin synthase catalytic subunit